ncbi:DUF4199 domain-containing protein [Hymenobacter convexus]|uniref:DUF4199 domain-containing protein n=1 Tax=Hymenobacter sp. CA1UV-4 TaxID=3063782 RepID=UPI002713883C|nr:DUF4199 domain-containing protein [Hymenobacter sp. CA1UV-4]MDO7853715.1 DUF4199 domain-containing protein [Hymenobacter sp. CA1UV-4]
METNTTSVTTTSVAVRYGVLTGLLSIIFSFILFVTHADQSPVRWLSLAILVGGMVLAHNAYKQGNQGFMNYSEGLGIGAIMSLISGTLSTAFSYVYMNFVDPDYMARVVETTRAKMEEKGGLTDEQIDQAIVMMKKFSSGGWMILFGVVGSLLFGFLIALVVSAITKNSKPEFE